MITSNPQLRAHMERFQRENDDYHILDDESREMNELDGIGTNEKDGAYGIKQPLSNTDANYTIPLVSNVQCLEPRSEKHHTSILTTMIQKIFQWSLNKISTDIKCYDGGHTNERVGVCCYNDIVQT